MSRCITYDLGRSSVEERRSDRYSSGSSRSPERLRKQHHHHHLADTEKRPNRQEARSSRTDSGDQYRHTKYSDNDNRAHSSSQPHDRKERYSDRESRSKGDKSTSKSKKRQSSPDERLNERKRRGSERRDDNEYIHELRTHDGHIVRVKPKSDGKFELA